ncbi:MAG: VanW family protein [bacterium]
MEEAQITAPKRFIFGKPIKIVGLIFLFAVFLLTIILFGQDKMYADSLFPHTKIAGIDLGEKKLDDAYDKLHTKLAVYVKTQINIIHKDTSWSFSLQDIGVQYDIEKTLKSVDIHKKSNYQLLKIKNLFGQEFEKPMIFDFDQEKLNELITTIDTEASIPYQNASLNIGDSGISQTQSRLGVVVDKIRLKVEILNHIANMSRKQIKLPQNFISPKVKVENLDQTRDQVEKISQSPITLYNYDFDKKYSIGQNTLLSWLSFKEFLVWEGKVNTNSRFAKIENSKEAELDNQKILHLSNLLGIPGIDYNMQVVLDDDKLNQFLKEVISDDLNKDPVNVKLSFINNELKVIKPEENGWRVDEATLKADLEQAIRKSEQYIKISLEEVLADARVDNLDELGIRKLISTGKSNFSGSPRNRIHNIRIGAAKYDGVLIKPNETFSFNDTLGKVDASTGYLPELVIKANETVPEYGGGLCQVSTTTFRAALNAGLPIIERKNHAYPVRYYKWPYTKYGTDATIYIGGSDVKFKNNTGNWILVQTRVEGSLLFYDFFGDTDGERKIELEMSEYGYGWRGSGSLKATVVYKVFVNGKMIHTQTFQSNYKSPNEFPHPGDEEEEKKEEPKKPAPPPSPPPEDPPPEDPPPEDPPE